MSVTDARTDTELVAPVSQYGAGVGNKRIAITLPEGLVASLKEEAFELDVSVSQLVKGAVRRELDILRTQREFEQDQEIDPALREVFDEARVKDRAAEIEKRYRR
ncbi:ribbon-helix-helix domain-containing protein [Symbioplanes lichenis]|uniref:ribbon-helix-helix domain-containing protein n=1 Tax=Symbioplanes lichenis TaxID=1629072 RepID=UPI0027393199|nr:hypothetical protein [Actinoplanes lichenis]